jgi:hypothetical protein
MRTEARREKSRLNNTTSLKQQQKKLNRRPYEKVRKKDEFPVAKATRKETDGE